jgi:hypothetical protein
MIFSGPARTLLVFAAIFLVSGGNAAADEPRRPPDTPALIDQLVKVADADLGYSPTVSGGAFLPIHGSGRVRTMLLLQKPLAPSEPLRELVKRGPEALPDLIAHLDDRRETSIRIEHPGAGQVLRVGGLWFVEQFDHNRRTDKPPAAERDRTEKASKDLTYTVTVGDLCFVAVGQIVNRSYEAVWYQPSMNILVNSPNRSAALRADVKRAWGTLTREQHRKALVADFLTPDHDSRRIGACLRLAYYYPDALEPLVLEFLNQQPASPDAAREFVRQKLYAAPDSKQARALFDDHVSRHGPAARDAVLLWLLDDLHDLEAEEEGRLRPPLREFGDKPRALLGQLFDRPKDVRSDDRPSFVETMTDADKARLIEEGLTYDRSEKIDRAVRDLLVSAKDDSLGLACTRRLVGRGYDKEIEAFCRAELARATHDAERRPLRAVLDRLGWTPLHVAADRGDVDAAEALVAGKAKADAAARNGRTPLHVAAAAGRAGMVRWLAEKGAAVDAADAEGRTPLHLAAAAGEAPAAEVLLALKADVAAKDGRGLTPLDLARRENQREVIEFLESHRLKP